MKKKYIYLDGIKSRYMIYSDGRIYNTEKDIFMKGGMDKDGYHIVSLSLNGKRFTRKFHRLVADAFIPNPNDLPLVNHKDGDKMNNHHSNLEWVTDAENVHHACEHKLRKSTIDKKTAKKICKMLESGKYRIYEISEKLGVSKSSISKIKNGTNWTSVSKDYDFSKVPKTKAMYGNKNPMSKIDSKTAKKIKKMLKQNISMKDVSKEIGCPYSVVTHIKYGHTWK